MASSTTIDSSPVKPNTSGNGAGASELALTLDVEPRKPRLVWQGMALKEPSVSVPAQVVEIVRPGKAIAAEDKLPGITAGQQALRLQEPHPNRLIWTNDNLVALRTLLDERDPATKEFRYRGKIDLVYIDPPFMVQGDFLADNAVDIELDEDEHVGAKKEPSLVEILAYKDTWRQGLDSFLSMLRERLVLLKALLAPTGSIYVHLDWHAVHYVKVLMDELFGYENFQNEIIWRRSLPHGNVDYKFGASHDSILRYTVSDNFVWNAQYTPHRQEYLDSFYKYKERDGRVYRLISCINPNPNRPNLNYEWNGVTRVWKYTRERMQRMHDAGLLVYSKNGIPSYKGYLDDMQGVPMQDIWTDIQPLMGSSVEWTSFPTQKPVALLERIISASSDPGGLVLDCFVGSGSTCEAAEKLGRRWIGIDNGKFAIHLARKRMIYLHGRKRPDESRASDRSYNVRPFSVENMGVYQRAEQWQNFQTQRSHYRDEMIKVFGGEVVNHSALLHGRKANSWVHVGPLDGPVSVAQVWSIAREAQKTDRKAVTILSADFDTLSGSEKDEIKLATGVTMTIRIIPASAIDEVRRRLEYQRLNPETPIESMAIPAFYAPLSIILSKQIAGRMAKLTLDRCEIDIESFIASQRPIIKPITSKMTAPAKKKVKGEIEKWQARQKELEQWLAKANTWQKFIDFWAVDWDYGRRVGLDEKPVFETDWQSFRVRRAKGEVEPLIFTAEYKYTEPGHYRVAARVTDVFGNDGIATVTMEVK